MKSLTPFDMSAPKDDRTENLYEQLYTDSKDTNIFSSSKKNLEELILTYNQDSMVSFIGAGTSQPLAIAGWKELMEYLQEKAEEHGFAETFPADKPKEWPSHAQLIYEHLKTNGHTKEYFRTIMQNMLPQNNSSTLTLIKLALAINIHLTTNFDESLEKAYDFLKFISEQFKKEKSFEYTTNCLPIFNLTRKENQSHIYYLHGNINEGVYIFKENDYDRFYPTVSRKEASSVLEDFIKLIYGSSHKCMHHFRPW